jgi:hypothetical protein
MKREPSLMKASLLADHAILDPVWHQACPPARIAV